jgi:N-acetylglucosamine-6-phosphate deacetylase
MAGSSVSMNRAVAVFLAYGGVSLEEAICAATRNPGRLLQDAEICSDVKVGQPANLVLFQPEPDRLKIESIVSAGGFA